MRHSVPAFSNGINGKFVEVVGNVGKGDVVETGNGALANEQYSISISNLISNVMRSGIVENTVKNAYHDIVSDQLLKGVSGLSASNILSVTDTLSGVKVFDINDWKQIAGACQAGKFDFGFLDQFGQVQAMFRDDGVAYANIELPDGTTNWYNIISPSKRNTGEEPIITGNRLVAIAKAAKTPLGSTNFSGTDVAYREYVAPSVLSTGDLQFNKSNSYAGVTAAIVGTNYTLAAVKKINRMT